MPLTASDLDSQAKLKAALEGESRAAKLENLGAALLGRLLGVTVAVAKSGFQYGGDAGPAGRQGRRLRVECKKYSDTTAFNERELLGEIDQALERDPALEAWVLMTTREVPEQIEQTLNQKGASIGVPVFILDWKGDGLTDLAALCASAPDLVANFFSAEAQGFARALEPIAGSAVDRIKRDLQVWSLGVGVLRNRSHEKLEEIWNSPRESNAALGQDAAGGSCPHRVRRNGVHEKLQDWWTRAARSDAPMAVIGLDGVGKTWATLDWFVDQKGELPIILVVPSSAAPALHGISETAVKLFLADRLYELMGVRDRDHWLRRLDRMLSRPSDEGPILTIFFDGLNQEPSVPWLQLLKVLQCETFASRIRVVVSTRTFHYETRLKNLRGLIVPAAVSSVNGYDLAPGGELDQMLAFKGLTRADLHSDIVALAQNPRLFRLVVQFSERMIESGQVTVHRLLWEYGRDSLGVRTGSFSEEEWRAWLSEIAERYRAGIREYSLRALGETASGSHLTESEVYARLSDIIDGRLTVGTAASGFHLAPTIVAHALGAALLARLEAVGDRTFEAVDTNLSKWLDPVAGLDQRAEILRAAVSIYVERGAPSASVVGGVLVTAWLHSQNITDAHRREIISFAGVLTDELLQTVEQSADGTHVSARLLAIHALRAIDRTSKRALELIVAKTRTWNCVVSRGIETRATHADAEKLRSQRFLASVGVDVSGPLQVLGLQLQLVDRDDGVLASTVAPILEGFPLASAVSVFEAAAISSAIDIRQGGWQSLKWLCLLNETDPDETAAALRAKSLEMKDRLPEGGINPDLSRRAASLLLRLTGQEDDETAAAKLEHYLDVSMTYEKAYLADPGRSMFALERRHADAVLSDTSLPLLQRANCCAEFWLDPNFNPPASYINEVRTAAAKIDVEKLDRHRGVTIEDHQFELLEPVLARCAPDVLADLTRQKLQSMATAPAESRYWCAVKATHAFVLAGIEEAKAANSLRIVGGEKIDDEECFVRHQLLILEILDLEGRQQVEAIISASLKFILAYLGETLRPLSGDDADSLISRFGESSGLQRRNLLILFGVHKIAFSDAAWRWVTDIAFGSDAESQTFAFLALRRSDPRRFGNELLTHDWSWSNERDYFVNDCGSGALLEGATELPFDEVAPRLAPWRLLEAARRRGSDPAEVRFAAEIFGSVLAAEGLESPDPGSDLTIHRTPEKSASLSFSVTPRRSREETDNPAVALRAAFDFDAQMKVHQRAVEVATQRWRDARRSGASLYLNSMDAEDFEPVLRHAPQFIDDWLTGSSELNSHFKRRVRLAEGAYLALCEALLTYDPSRGVALWRNLRSSLTTRFVGDAHVEEIIHLPFRAQDSSPVNELRAELVGLRLCHSDQALFNVALAAECNHKDEWLADTIGEDRRSSLAWRRMRAQVLEGFKANNLLPAPDAWLQGEINTKHEQLRWRSARLRFREAFARHWWRVYWAAGSAVAAYAAWVLFLRSVDRRASVWMNHDARAADDGSKLYQLKTNHVRLNRSELRRAMEKPERSLDRQFLDRETIVGLGPWIGLDT